MPYITSDWHIHTEASYDASLPVAALLQQADKQGLKQFGISDHVNLPSWIHYLKTSKELYQQHARAGFHFGVELTTISGYLEAYDRAHGSDEGYERPRVPGVDPIAFPLTAEELDECGVEYVIGAEHWLLNAPRTQDGVVKEMQRQNLYIATSPLVDIVGHPYCMYGTYENKLGQQEPFHDFSIVPLSMREELIAAMKENSKAMEANVSYFSGDYSERWRHDYAEFVRQAFEGGVPITIGTDCHGPVYADHNATYERYLAPLGFQTTDFSAPIFGRRRRG
ncbi:MAG: PHP domain-containing protein [Christensenellales bacterium]